MLQFKNKLGRYESINKNKRSPLPAVIRKCNRNCDNDNGDDDNKEEDRDDNNDGQHSQ